MKSKVIKLSCKTNELYHAKIPKKYDINVDNFLAKNARKMEKIGKTNEKNIEEQTIA